MVVLDLRELMFIDLSGVRVIVDASIEAWLANRRLLLVRGPSQVDRVFELAGVSDVVEIGDLHPPEPPVSALLRFAPEDQPAWNRPRR
jgi:anti-anti-sigma factor